jgi:cobalamin biosynthesis protein CobT
MSTSSRVAGAVAAGYVLGRFKKLRLAVIVASAMSSPKVRSAAVGMIQERIPGGAMVGTLTKGVGGKLVDAGKTAATSIVASRIDTLSQSLADRSQNLRKGTPDGQSRKSRADEPGDGRAPEEEAYDEEESDAAEEPEDEYDEEESDATEEPEDEYDEEERDATEEPEDEYDEEESNATEEPEDEGAQTTADDDESPVEEPEEPRVARSPRRPRSASPAGRRRG